jgi:prepilin-type N-terminal cleavage/methylation domain-containing protein
MKMYQMKSLKQHTQAGFTLIELVVVIVILGILAATALPRFFDLTTDARKAAVAGVTGGFTSGIAMEHAKWLVDGSVPGAAVNDVACVAGTTCVAGTSAIIEGQTVGYNAFGYPTSDDTAPALTATTGLMTIDPDVCVKLWTVVLSSGRPTATTNTAATSNGGFEWGASAAGDVCTFTYYGGAKIPTARFFTYTTETGAVVLTNL